MVGGYGARDEKQLTPTLALPPTQATTVRDAYSSSSHTQHALTMMVSNNEVVSSVPGDVLHCLLCMKHGAIEMDLSTPSRRRRVRRSSVLTNGVSYSIMCNLANKPMG